MAADGCDAGVAIAKPRIDSAAIGPAEVSTKIAGWVPGAANEGSTQLTLLHCAPPLIKRQGPPAAFIVTLAKSEPEA